MPEIGFGLCLQGTAGCGAGKHTTGRQHGRSAAALRSSAGRWPACLGATTQLLQGDNTRHTHVGLSPGVLGCCRVGGISMHERMCRCLLCGPTHMHVTGRDGVACVACVACSEEFPACVTSGKGAHVCACKQHNAAPPGLAALLHMACRVNAGLAWCLLHQPRVRW